MKSKNTIAIGYSKAEDDITINSCLDKARIVFRIQQAYSTGQLMADLTGVKDDGLYLTGKIKLNTGKKITAKFLERLDEEGRMFPAKK